MEKYILYNTDDDFCGLYSSNIKNINEIKTFKEYSEMFEQIQKHLSTNNGTINALGISTRVGWVHNETAILFCIELDDFLKSDWKKAELYKTKEGRDELQKEINKWK